MNPPDAHSREGSMGDLRKFIQQAEAEGALLHVKDADPHLEIGAIYELSQEQKYPPALLFADMRGCDRPRPRRCDPPQMVRPAAVPEADYGGRRDVTAAALTCRARSARKISGHRRPTTRTSA
jgi:hypothetical protein